MLYSNGTYDLNSGPISVSYYFLAQNYTAVNTSRVALGLSYDQTSFVSASRGETRLIKSGAAATSATFEARGSTGGSSASGVTLTNNNWYLLTVTYSLSATLNGLDISSTLQDYGATGIEIPSLVASANGTYVNASFFTASGSGVAKPLYVGMELQNVGGGGIALDDLTINSVPEPKPLALLGSALLCILMWRIQLKRRW